METPLHTGRDPVCKSIESLLHNLEAKGKGHLVRTEDETMVRLRFGSLQAEAVTGDIALVRLASAMIDDDRYRQPLVEMLRELRHASS